MNFVKVYNLKKLVEFLEENYDTVNEHFDMSVFHESWGGPQKAVDHQCGTDKCLLGWGVAVFPDVAKRCRFWSDFSEEVFGINWGSNIVDDLPDEWDMEHLECLWEFMFHEDWNSDLSDGVVRIKTVIELLGKRDYDTLLDTVINITPDNTNESLEDSLKDLKVWI